MGISAVWGPPQSGKTTVAIDLAFALSMQGKSVCLISPELYCELGARLNLRVEPEKSLLAAYRKSESLKQIVCEADELLYVLAAPFDNDAFGEDMPEDAAKALLTQAGRCFDAVIVDCPSYAGSALAAWALNCADTVLMMSGAHSASVMWYNSFQKAVTAVRQKTIHVCAEINESFDYRTLHSMLSVSPDVHLPHISDAAMLQLLKRTLYQLNGKAGAVYSRGIDQLCTLFTGEEVETE